MDTTPRSKKSLSCRRAMADVDTAKDNEAPSTSALNRTPSASRRPPSDRENDDSPVYFPTTQEWNDDIDVVWDWNSPQASQRQKKKQKRVLPFGSPKVPLKRHPSNNRIQTFDRLQEELRALQEELAHVDDESVLCVSPQQEEEFRDLGLHNNNSNSNNVLVEEFAREEELLNDLDDVFNDSFDDELLKLTQKAESNLAWQHERTKNTKQQVDDTTDTTRNLLFDTTEINNIVNKYAHDGGGGGIADDSFDLVLSQIRDEDIDKRKAAAASAAPKAVTSFFGRSENLILSRNQVAKSSNFKRTVSEYKYTSNSVRAISDNAEFHRTRSFEMDAVNENGIVLPKSTLEEIERKRLEAKARLELKRKQETGGASPPKCSLLEIERKRQQALARLKTSPLKHAAQGTERKRSQAVTNPRSWREDERSEAPARAQPKASSGKCTADEIERKRLEALAKLGSKVSPSKCSPEETERKRREAHSKPETKVSPSKCSLEEIDRKRREAQAKLEAKKLQEMLERKRREALKRLQQNKLKKGAPGFLGKRP